MYLCTSTSGSSWFSTCTSFVWGCSIIGATGGASIGAMEGASIGDGGSERLLPVLGEGECGMVTVGVSIGRSLKVE